MIHNIIHGMYEGNFSFLILVAGILTLVVGMLALAVGILQVYLLIKKRNKQ